MFLEEPPASETTDAAYAADQEADGYVSNITRLWCWRPDLDASFSALRASLMHSSALTEREWAVLVSSAVAECKDSYCSLAWGPRLAKLTDVETAAQVVARLREVGLGDREIFEATALIAFRLAFSTINDALGAAPDRQLADAAPDPIRAAVSYGRAPSSAESVP
jgi:alkylhydroperoxidase/carboxymuconolactone decarboxylase family protein YurZ